MSQALYSN